MLPPTACANAASGLAAWPREPQLHTWPSLSSARRGKSGKSGSALRRPRRASEQFDDTKKEWCLSELDTKDDEKKSLEHDISDLEKAIADAVSEKIRTPMVI